MSNASSGYSGWSMSLNAAAAYEEGEMPKSKWSKKAIIAAVKRTCDEYMLVYDPDIEKMKKAELFDKFIYCSSWHHTSKFFNETDFYSVDEDAIMGCFRPMNEEELAVRAEHKEQEAAERRARVEWQEKKPLLYMEYWKAHDIRPDSVSALAFVHPESCSYRTSKKGNPVVDYEDSFGKHTCLVEDMAYTTAHGFNATDELFFLETQGKNEPLNKIVRLDSLKDATNQARATGYELGYGNSSRENKTKTNDNR